MKSRRALGYLFLAAAIAAGVGQRYVWPTVTGLEWSPIVLVLIGWTLLRAADRSAAKDEAARNQAAP